MTLGRRQFLGLGGLAAALAVAGCARHEAGTPTVSGSSTPSSAGTSGTDSDADTDTDTNAVVTDPGAPTPVDGIAELRGTGQRMPGAEARASGAALASVAATLFRAAAGGTGNVVISPYSVLVALGMTQYAARGDAAAAMAQVLGGDAETVAGWVTAVDTAVAQAVAAGDQNSSHAAVQTVVDPANSLFVQRGLPVRQEFLGQLATGYGAGLRTCDFVADPESCRAAINTWVARRTHQLISELLASDAVDDATRMVVVNALYLSAAWDTEFQRGPAADFAAVGGTVSVPYLGIAERFDYAAGDGWASVSVPYAGGGLAMTILLPDDGAFGDVARGLDGDLLSAASTGSAQRVAVRMPPFSARTALPLAEPLTGMGLGPMIGGDFSGVTGHRDDVTVKEVIHQAAIEVDEHGTTAAAATAVIGPVGAAPGHEEPDPIEFVANRPFLYWIHDTATGCPLFLGRVTDPTG